MHLIGGTQCTVCGGQWTARRIYISSILYKTGTDCRKEACRQPTSPTARMHTSCSRKQLIPLCWRMELSVGQWCWECHCKSWPARPPPCGGTPWYVSHFPHCPCSPLSAQLKTRSAMRLFEHQWHSCIQQRASSFLQRWAPHPALQLSSWHQPSLRRHIPQKLKKSPHSHREMTLIKKTYHSNKKRCDKFLDQPIDQA